jgi:hypothetical protein
MFHPQRVKRNTSMLTSVLVFPRTYCRQKHDRPAVQYTKQCFKSVMMWLCVTTSGALCTRVVFIIRPSNGGQTSPCFKLDALVSMEMQVVVDHDLAFKKIRNISLFKWEFVCTGRVTNRQTDEQAGRQAGRQRDRQTEYTLNKISVKHQHTLPLPVIRILETANNWHNQLDPCCSLPFAFQ